MQNNHTFLQRMIFHCMLGCLLIAIAGCDHKKSAQQADKGSPKPLAVVEMAVADFQPLNHRIQLTGTLEPKKLVHLYNQAPGLILSLPFYESDKVQQGDILAKLDDTIIKAEFNKASANYRQSKLDYGRLRTLSKKNLTSKELLTQAQTKVELDKAEYQLQQKRLSNTKIEAPWSGIISERLHEPGDVLPLHTHFMTLMDISSLIVKVPLSELYLPLVKTGDPVVYKLDALGSQQYSGKISRIYPEVNAPTRKGIIEILLTDIPAGAMPGQLARITLPTEKENVLVVPLSAIRYDQQGAFVFKINADNSIQRTVVTTGKKFPDLIEIIDGLQAQDRVVKKGLFGLRSGKKVNIINAVDE